AWSTTATEQAASRSSPGEAAVAGTDVSTGEVLGHLGALVDKSLVQFGDAGIGPGRDRLLEAVRQYAAPATGRGGPGGGRRGPDRSPRLLSGPGRYGSRAAGGRRSGSVAAPARCRAEQPAGRHRRQLDRSRSRAGPAAGRLVAGVLGGTRARRRRCWRAAGAPGCPSRPGGDAAARPGPSRVG